MRPAKGSLSCCCMASPPAGATWSWDRRRWSAPVTARSPTTPAATAAPRGRPRPRPTPTATSQATCGRCSTTWRSTAPSAVRRSPPFARMEDLAAIEAPTLVVVSRDEADPGHPYEVGEAYAEAIPGARLVSEEPGQSPLAWQGGQLSQVIGDLAAAA